MFSTPETKTKNQTTKFDNQHCNRGMTMITPASQWREGLLSGNGTIGALVYGSINLVQ
ncbi:hypothetical protein [Mariniflexile fucanivorans]|uniref:hypothetical protein n=1 Tax=Mariniflexile fucanivorans TaxID=264023 RepID=UPI001A9DF2F8|nr:hypothetical protein [Mariniflexile fucanivorans]